MKSKYLVLLLMLALVAAACGGDDSSDTTEAPDATEAPAATEAPDTTEAMTDTTEAMADTTTTADEAADYPDQPITYIVAFDPGGGSDTEARRIQSDLEAILGQQIQVEYRSGGGGAVGWSEFVGTEPDGYTAAGLVLPHIVIQPLALDDPGYQTDEIRAVAWTVGAPAALLVPEDSEFETIDDFLAFAEANPGEVTVGGVATFSGSDLALAQVVAETGIEVAYIPISGGAAPIITDLLGGHIDAAMLATTHAVRTDGVKTLAIAGDERFPGLPDTPTFSEVGANVTVTYAWGAGVPADTPDAIANKLGNAIIQAMMDGGHDESVVDEGYFPIMMGPDEANAFVEGSVATFETLLPFLEALHGS